MFSFAPISLRAPARPLCLAPPPPPLAARRPPRPAAPPAAAAGNNNNSSNSSPGGGHSPNSPTPPGGVDTPGTTPSLSTLPVISLPRVLLPTSAGAARLYEPHLLDALETAIQDTGGRFIHAPSAGAGPPGVERGPGGLPKIATLARVLRTTPLEGGREVLLEYEGLHRVEVLKGGGDGHVTATVAPLFDEEEGKEGQGPPSTSSIIPTAAALEASLSAALAAVCALTPGAVLPPGVEEHSPPPPPRSGEVMVSEEGVGVGGARKKKKGDVAAGLAAAGHSTAAAAVAAWARQGGGGRGGRTADAAPPPPPSLPPGGDPLLAAAAAAAREAAAAAAPPQPAADPYALLAAAASSPSGRSLPATATAFTPTSTPSTPRHHRRELFSFAAADALDMGPTEAWALLEVTDTAARLAFCLAAVRAHLADLAARAALRGVVGEEGSG